MVHFYDHKTEASTQTYQMAEENFRTYGDKNSDKVAFAQVNDDA